LALCGDDEWMEGDGEGRLAGFTMRERVLVLIQIIALCKKSTPEICEPEIVIKI
jgi:hypothetical protein